MQSNYGHRQRSATPTSGASVTSGRYGAAAEARFLAIDVVGKGCEASRGSFVGRFSGDPSFDPSQGTKG